MGSVLSGSSQEHNLDDGAALFDHTMLYIMKWSCSVLVASRNAPDLALKFASLGSRGAMQPSVAQQGYPDYAIPTAESTVG